MRTAILAAAFALGAAAPLHAHRLIAEARAAGADVVVTAAYEGGSPARGARVTVTAAGETVASGVTDDNGVFRFAAPEDRELAVAITDGAGHRADLVLAAPSQSAVEGSARAGRSALGMADYGPLWLRVLAGLAGIALLLVLLRAFLARPRSPDAP
jgi:hypothetical protein